MRFTRAKARCRKDADRGGVSAERRKLKISRCFDNPLREEIQNRKPDNWLPVFLQEKICISVSDALIHFHLMKKLFVIATLVISAAGLQAEDSHAFQASLT